MTMYTEGLYHSSLALNQDQIHLNIGSYLQAKSGEQGNENRDNLYFVITLNSNGNGVKQGSPTPGPQTGTGLWPVRNWTAQQEVSGR